MAQDKTEARLVKLEKAATKLDQQMAKAKQDLTSKASKNAVARVANDLNDAEKEIKRIIKWIKLEQKWSEEVTKMLRLINWDLLATDYPGGGGTNPPQTPPSWPPPDEA
jgi:hypothetical protein